MTDPWDDNMYLAISLRLNAIFPPNVGKSCSPMDPMGIWSTPLKINGWNMIMEVWKIRDHFPRSKWVICRWTMLIFQGVYNLQTSQHLPRRYDWTPQKMPRTPNVREVLLMEEILHHLGCVKPCIQWDKLPITWCRISSINSMTGGLGNIACSCCCCCCWCSVAGVTLAMPPRNSHRQDHCLGSRFCTPN